jgi:isopentenyldiphosphate isomerase
VEGGRWDRAGIHHRLRTLSEETEEGKFVSQEEFKQLVESKPEIFTPDTLLAPEYYPRKG